MTRNISICWRVFLLLLDSENGCPPYLNSTSGFDFDLFTVHRYQHSILHRHTKFHPNQSMHSRVVMSYRSFKMVAIELENYTWLPFWWPRLSRNIKIYLHTKFWWDISIHSYYFQLPKRDIHPLKFYFQFLFWPIHSILHRHAKFHPNRSMHHGVMTSCQFSKTAAGSHIGFHVGIQTIREVRLRVPAWSTNLESIRFIVSEILPYCLEIA